MPAQIKKKKFETISIYLNMRQAVEKGSALLLACNRRKPTKKVVSSFSKKRRENTYDFYCALHAVKIRQIFVI